MATETETKLREALLGTDPDMPDQIRPLSWLHTMLTTCEAPGAAEKLCGDDPAAWADVCQEVRGLYEQLREILGELAGTESGS